MNKSWFVCVFAAILAVSLEARELTGPWWTGGINGTPSLSTRSGGSFVWGSGSADSSTANQGGLWSYFDRVAFTRDGDTLTLALTLTSFNSVSGSQSMRFGLFNDGGSKLETDLYGANGDPGLAKSKGFYLNWTTQGGLSLFEQQGGNNSPCSGGVQLGGTVGGLGGIVANRPMEIIFTICRLSETGYEVTASIQNGGVLKTVTALAKEPPVVDSVTMFYMINTNTKVHRLTFDNLRVTFNRQAWEPEPADGAVNQPLVTTLGWQIGLDPNDFSQFNRAISKHLLYGTFNNASPADPNLHLIAEIPVSGSAASYALPALQRDRVYTWRVDEYEAAGRPVVTGPVWSFETIPSVPVISRQPQSAYVFDGDLAAFAVEAVNPFTGDAGGLNYQWYKGLPGDTGQLVGANAAQLDFASASLADEAGYYCRITIPSNGRSVDSEAATLVIKRLMAHWPLDGDPNDIANGYDGVAAGDPAYGSGLLGQAIMLDGMDDQVVCTFAQETVIPRFTTALWVWTGNPAQATNASPFNNNSSAADFQFDVSGGAYRYAGSATVALGPIPAEGAWVHLAASCDGATTRMFYNGLEVAERPVADNRFGQMALGVNRTGTVRFSGKVDDLRLYNYDLTGLELAAVFTDVMGGDLCVERPIGDLDGDCRVTLADFVRLALDWFECGLVPDCLP